MLKVGVTVTENIVECVDRSQKFLMILSNSFLQSQWCLFETHVAQHQMVQQNRFVTFPNYFEINHVFIRDSILLVLKENITRKINRDINYLLKTRTYLKWPNTTFKQHQFWLKLKQSLLIYKPFSLIVHSKKRLRLNSL